MNCMHASTKPEITALTSINNIHVTISILYPQIFRTIIEDTNNTKNIIKNNVII